MASILLLTRAVTPSSAVLPGLELLSHHVKIMTPEPTALLAAPPCDLVFVDARADLPAARSLCRLMEATGNTSPVIVIATEGGLAAIAPDWGVADVILDSAGPAEIETRIRLAVGRVTVEYAQPSQAEIHAGDLVIDETAYSAKLRGRILDLTYKEFELLKYLAQHPGRVFSRSQLLQEVWGYDYFGGTRTVDVHVRRLRAKLGVENESLIGTVRNVGYRFIAGNVDAAEDSLV